MPEREILGFRTRGHLVFLSDFLSDGGGRDDEEEGLCLHHDRPGAMPEREIPGFRTRIVRRWRCLVGADRTHSELSRRHTIQKWTSAVMYICPRPESDALNSERMQ